MTLPGRLDLPGDPAELTLELARRSHEPAAADRARNLAALRSRLGLPAPPGCSVPSAPSALAPAARARSLQLAPWQQLVTVGALTGTIGFFLGLGMSDRTTLAPLRAPAASAASAGASDGAGAPDVQPRPETEAAAASGNVERSVPDLAQSGSESAAEQSSAGQSAGAQSTAGQRPAARAPAPRTTKARRPAALSPPAERSAPDFREAVRLLGRARRALDRQEPTLALALLDELDAHFPQELLDEERAASRVLALCANGDQPRALALARSEFSARPLSIYSRRLEHSCAQEALRR